MIVRIILSKEAKEVYDYLNEVSKTSKIEKSIFTAINNKIDLIKINPHYGQPVSKNKIPIDYVEKYDIKRLFRVSLPNFWRMEYTLTNNDSEIEIIAFLLNIFDHKEYNKIHKYK
ncbi:hypothetical protein M0P25_04205 [archaeon]|jgi:hypothetical protein|nr:hypothetical protein [archaeon]MCK9439696.1 hypothetical protein [Patescibacteria group bacterium]